MLQTALLHVQDYGPLALPHQQEAQLAQSLQRLAESVLAKHVKVETKRSVLEYWWYTGLN
jgi:hypothetical protein